MIFLILMYLCLYLLLLFNSILIITIICYKGIINIKKKAKLYLSNIWELEIRK